MADIVSAVEVGRIVSYIAPGFVARAAYAARFARPEASQFATLVSSVVLSLPLVALANGLADLVNLDRSVAELGYVALLLSVSVLAGYLYGAARGSAGVRSAMRMLRLAYQPDASIYAQTLLALPPDAPVTVAFKDGRKLSGTPKLGPGRDTDGVTELYLTHPAWWHESSGWIEKGAGGAVIVPLSEIQTLTLDRDPTP